MGGRRRRLPKRQTAVLDSDKKSSEAKFGGVEVSFKKAGKWAKETIEAQHQRVLKIIDVNSKQQSNTSSDKAGRDMVNQMDVSLENNVNNQERSSEASVNSDKTSRNVSFSSNVSSSSMTAPSSSRYSFSQEESCKREDEDEEEEKMSTSECEVTETEETVDSKTIALQYREYSLTKDGRQRLIELNAVPKLVNLVRSEEPEVKLNALRALFNLSVVDESTRKQIVSAGAVPLLLSAALEQNQAQPNAVGTLANLATESDIKLIIVSKYNGLTPILSLLRSEDTTVKAHACRALFAIAANDDNKLAIAEAGGLPLLLECMSSNNVAVQINAAGALANLAIHQYNKPKLVEGGALQIMRRMAYSDSDKVQRQVARCLFALAAHTENRRHIVETNCLSALAYMLCIPKEEVQRNAAGALGNVAMSDDFKGAVVDSGALRPLIMLTQSNSECVQRQAARAIFTLSAKEGVKQKIIEVNGLPSIIALTNSSSVEIQRDSAGALANMAIGPGNKDLVIEFGGLEPLLKLLKSDEPLVQRQAARAVFALAGSETNQTKIIRAGALPLLVNLLESQEDVQKHAAGAIANLSTLHMAEVVATNALPKMINLVLHSPNLEVRRQAARALINLSPEEGAVLNVSRYVGHLGEKQRLRHEMRSLYEKTCVPLHTYESNILVAAPTFYDMVLSCEDPCGFKFFIPAHMSILCARSSALKDMITQCCSIRNYLDSSNTYVSRIQVHLVYPRLIWETVLEFLYTDSIRCNGQKIKETRFAPLNLATLAHDLELPRLVCFAQELAAKSYCQQQCNISSSFPHVDRSKRSSCFSQNMVSALSGGVDWLADVSVCTNGNIPDMVEHSSPRHYEKRRKGLKESQAINMEGMCTVNVHKAILSARCSYFRSKFSSPWVDSKFSVIDFYGSDECLKVILRYIYCASDKMVETTLKENPSLTLETLFKANEYNLEGLASLCESILCKCIDSDSVFVLLREAYKTHAPFLQIKCIYFVLKEGLPFYDYTPSATSVAVQKRMQQSGKQQPNLVLPLQKKIQILGKAWNLLN